MGNKNNKEIPYNQISSNCITFILDKRIEDIVSDKEKGWFLIFEDRSVIRVHYGDERLLLHKLYNYIQGKTENKNIQYNTTFIFEFFYGKVHIHNVVNERMRE